MRTHGAACGEDGTPGVPRTTEGGSHPEPPSKPLLGLALSSATARMGLAGSLERQREEATASHPLNRSLPSRVHRGRQRRWLRAVARARYTDPAAPKRPLAPHLLVVLVELSSSLGQPPELLHRQIHHPLCSGVQVTDPDSSSGALRHKLVGMKAPSFTNFELRRTPSVRWSLERCQPELD